MPAPLDRARGIALMAFDVDGVLTDGGLFVGPAGEEMKVFNSLDGQGMKMLQENGVALALITGRNSASVTWRARELGITHLYQGVHDKLDACHDILDKTGLRPDQFGYMGDDLPDLRLLSRCGFAATVPQAPDAVKQAAHYVCTRDSGRGAVREVCDFILRAQGKLDAAITAYRT
jgi:3-deoxy-D-manno-octulosonate 8-phosphate phosphatase (KDO 8-P phosphatase)